MSPHNPHFDWLIYLPFGQFICFFNVIAIHISEFIAFNFEYYWWIIPVSDMAIKYYTNTLVNG
jgi:hypothetical protein